jgi:hypothetical protein
MTMISAMRDFAEGLTRGFSLFLTERHNVAERAFAPSSPKRRNTRQG